jgi:hypothetical protein
VYSALDLHYYKRYWGGKERDCIIGECTSKRVVYRGLLWWKGLKRRVKAFIWAMAWLGHDSLCQLSTNSSRNKAKHSLLYLQGYTILKTCNIINMLDQSNHFKSLVSSNRSTHLRERERERERERDLEQLTSSFQEMSNDKRSSILWWISKWKAMGRNSYLAFMSSRLVAWKFESV